jgi:hypothetical protein
MSDGNCWGLDMGETGEPRTKDHTGIREAINATQHEPKPVFTAR